VLALLPALLLLLPLLALLLKVLPVLLALMLLLALLPALLPPQSLLPLAKLMLVLLLKMRLELEPQALTFPRPRGKRRRAVALAWETSEQAWAQNAEAAPARRLALGAAPGQQVRHGPPPLQLMHAAAPGPGQRA